MSPANVNAQQYNGHAHTRKCKRRNLGKKSQKITEGDSWKFFLRNNHNKNNPKALSTALFKQPESEADCKITVCKFSTH